jgi:hypothetical protein
MAPFALTVDPGTLCLACGAAFLVSSKLAQPRPVPPVMTKSGRAAPVAPPSRTPCPKCAGKRKLTCVDCDGVGRLNHRDQIILPAGENPQWCPYCRGTGQARCSRCFGTGKQQNMIGFRPPS